jgi:hypothetical protein
MLSYKTDSLSTKEKHSLKITSRNTFDFHTMMTSTITNENNNIISYRPSSTIESISIVPTVGDASSSSSSSVMVDVTAMSRTAAVELRRIQSYSSQLFIPEEMIYGNDQIKVWNIHDERQVQDSSSSSMEDITLIKEEATFDKFSVTTGPMMTTIEEPPQKETKTMIMDMMDDSSTNNSIKMMMQPSLSPTKMIVLDDSISISFDESESESYSDEKDSSQMECTTTTTTTTSTTTNGRQRNRRGHRRHHSHFDFSF